MARTATIVLDAQPYVVHALNIGEIEQVQEAMSGPSGKVAFIILAAALKRATPSVADDAQFRALEPTSTEIKDAVQAIMKLSGMEETTSGPPA